MFCNKKEKKSSNITSVYERSVLGVGLPDLLQLGRVGMGHPTADSCWVPANLKLSEVGFFGGVGKKNLRVAAFPGNYRTV